MRGNLLPLARSAVLAGVCAAAVGSVHATGDSTGWALVVGSNRPLTRSIPAGGSATSTPIGAIEPLTVDDLSDFGKELWAMRQAAIAAGLELKPVAEIVQEVIDSRRG